MGFVQHVRGRSISSAFRAAAACTCLLCVAAQATAQKSSHHTKSAPPDPWQAAVSARTELEAQPARTRADYGRVLDQFRAIYHANPGDVHAPAAIAQVAALLAEQGVELNDDKSLHNSMAQCEFLSAQYPQSSAAKSCRTQAESSAHTIVAHSAPETPQPETKAAAPQAAEVESQKLLRRKGTAAAPPSAEEIPGPTLAEVASTPEANHTGGTARVTGIRHWSTPSYTRVAIDLGDEVQYEAAHVEHPDRIYFDLHHTHLAPELAGKAFNVTDDGLLTRIRAAQFSGDVTRVVLDLKGVAEYSAFLLPNPYRLIIDIHGKPGPANATPEVAHHDVANSSVASPLVDTSSTRLAAGNGSITPARVDAVRQPARTPDVAVASADHIRTQPEPGSVSRLPPMPVTDGSASFGLPPKSAQPASAAATEVVSAPRVVIPTRPTPAKPVPNSVSTRASNTSTEVAAVSDQPGKVEATSKPTSAPISSGATGSKRHKAAELEVSAPVEAPPPTADGQTSLVRALGLKIGRIVIDAGHGGHDSGTLGAGGIQEKDVVLDVALRLGKLLHQRLGAEIVYTRADDTFIPLETRTAIANKAQADLFISVHANSSQDDTARGVEVYYLNFTSDPEAMRVAGRENAVSTQSVHELSDLVKKIALKDKIDESKELAADVDTSLYTGLHKGNEGLKDRGVKKAPFVVLIGANMPSILAEISFVTNPDDARQLETPEYRQRVAESLFNGVARYAGAINGVKPELAKKTPALQRVAAKR